VRALAALLILAGGGFVMVLTWRYGMTRGVDGYVRAVHRLLEASEG
jgi:hypothetical protein